MTKPLVNEILQSARIVELREAVLEVAALAKSPPVELPRSNRSQRLIRLLVRERKRNARLVAELTR
jgi:hypothetical protein